MTPATLIRCLAFTLVPPAAIGFAACGRPPAVASPSGPGSASSASSASAAPAPASAAPEHPIAAVEATILFTDCPSAPVARSNAVQATINRLVDSCTSVPQGNARFMATLLRDGRIELSPPEGQSDGVVPLCVLRNELRHHLLVVKPCRMQVELVQRPSG